MLSLSAAARLVLSIECLVLGCLALWPGLRTTVQARLASMGEGVAAAAGIAELLGGSTSKHLIAQSELTLRSVRLDLVLPEHFDTHQSAGIAAIVVETAGAGALPLQRRRSGWRRPGPRDRPPPEVLF